MMLVHDAVKPAGWPPLTVADAASLVLDEDAACVEATRTLALASDADWFIDAAATAAGTDFDLTVLGTGDRAAWSTSAAGIRATTLLAADGDDFVVSFSDAFVGAGTSVTGSPDASGTPVSIFVDLSVGWTEPEGWIETRILLIASERGWWLVSVDESADGAVDYEAVELLDLLSMLCADSKVPAAICALTSSALERLAHDTAGGHDPAGVDRGL